MVQHITFHEFLPIILGAKEMDKYELVLQEKGYYKGIAKMLYSVCIDPFCGTEFICRFLWCHWRIGGGCAGAPHQRGILDPPLGVTVFIMIYMFTIWYKCVQIYSVYI